MLILCHSNFDSRVDLQEKGIGDDVQADCMAVLDPFKLCRFR